MFRSSFDSEILDQINAGNTDGQTMNDAQYGAMAQHSVYPYRSTFYVSLFQAG